MAAPPHQQAAYGYTPAYAYGSQSHQPLYQGSYDPHYIQGNGYDSPSNKRARQNSSGWVPAAAVTAPQQAPPQWPSDPSYQQSYPAQQPYSHPYAAYQPPVPTSSAQTYSQWHGYSASHCGTAPSASASNAPSPHVWSPTHHGAPNGSSTHIANSGAASHVYYPPPPQLQAVQAYDDVHKGVFHGERPGPSSIQYRPGQQIKNAPRPGGTSSQSGSTVRKRTVSQSIEPMSAIHAIQDDEIYLPQYHDHDFQADCNGRPEVQPDKADEHFFANKEENPNLSLGTIVSKSAQYLRMCLPSDFEAATAKMQHQWQTPPKDGTKSVIVSCYAHDQAVPSYETQDSSDPSRRDPAAEKKASYSIKYLMSQVRHDTAARPLSEPSVNLFKSDFQPADFHRGEYPVPIHTPGSRYDFRYDPVPQVPDFPIKTEQRVRRQSFSHASSGRLVSERKPGHGPPSEATFGRLVHSHEPQFVSNSAQSSSHSSMRMPNTAKPGDSAQVGTSSVETPRSHDASHSRPNSSHANVQNTVQAQSGRATTEQQKHSLNTNSSTSRRPVHYRNGSMEEQKIKSQFRPGHRRNSSVEEPKIFEKDPAQESILASLGVTGSATNVFSVPGPARSRSASPIRGTTPQQPVPVPNFSKRMPKIPAPSPHPPPLLKATNEPSDWCDPIRPASRGSAQTAYGGLDEDEENTPPTQPAGLTPIKEIPEEPNTVSARKRKILDDDSHEQPVRLRQRPDHTTPFKNRGPRVDPAYRRRW